jgi:hypothetical protein
VAQDHNGRNFDPGTRAILTELRDLHLEMRADRQQDREERREERRQSDERFERLIRELHEDTRRRDAAMQRAFKDIHTVGVAIVKTLNGNTRILKSHTRILERIDRKLGVRGNGGPGRQNGPRLP